MKNQRACNNMPIYPQMPYPVPMMPYNYQQTDTIDSRISALEQQVNSLEQRVSRLESGNNSNTYNKYNDSNYYMV